MNKTINKIQKLLLQPTRLSCKEIGDRLVPKMSRQNVTNIIKRKRLKAPYLKITYPQGNSSKGVAKGNRKVDNVVTGL